nr:retrovirus-related Pol polyprotein from transposon TNT 1-94 [Tanacetum cinerariifolium]
MLKKFDMESVRTATTPYDVPKTKSKDEPDDAVNVYLYRSMIGSLMYLTASRPDIMFAVSACSRHQVTPMTSHLNAVKKIFKYLKSVPASSVLAGGVLAGSVDSAGFGDPATSESVPAVFNPDLADNSTFPLGPSLGSSEHSTRFPSAFDLGNHQPKAGIFSSSSYDDDFYADVTNLASSVAVDPVATKRQVWKLVPLPNRKIAIGTKWILKNKRDARGIVVRNKARLVAQGHRQEDGIDYDEVFTPVARIEAIRLFLAFALYMGFMVYQMDVKSAFLYGFVWTSSSTKGLVCQIVYLSVKASLQKRYIDKTLFIKKDSRHIILVQVYVDDIIFGSMNKAWCDEFEVLMKREFEMSAICELTFFLGLQVTQLPDGIFISQDKYVKDMLKKFDMESVRTTTTPYEVPKTKSKDEPDDAVNVHLYRSMIGSLMYLTASKPNIMFAVYGTLEILLFSWKHTVIVTMLGLMVIENPLLVAANFWVEVAVVRPLMLLVVQVFLLVVLVHVDGLVPAGSYTIPTELASPEQTDTDQMLLFYDPAVFGVPAGFLIPAGFWLMLFGCLLLFCFVRVVGITMQSSSLPVKIYLES